MATLDSVMTKLRNLLASLNTKTGRTDATFTDAINSLPSKADRAQTTITATANAAKDMITIAATNPQTSGIVTADTAKDTSVATVIQSVDGNKVYAWVDDGQAPIEAEVATVTQSAPVISVSSAGLITASATQSAGYVSAGTKSATKQLTTQAAKTVIPSTVAQFAVAGGVYTTGAIDVAGDTNLIPGNIKKGVSIFGIPGSYEGDSSSSTEDSTGSIATCNVKIDVSSLTNTVRVFYTACDFQLQALFSILEDESPTHKVNYDNYDPFIAYDYKENPNGVIVPVLYKTNIESYPDEIDYEEPYYYVGTYAYGSEVYDKWQKDESLTNSPKYTWDSSYKQYVLTERIVENGIINIPNGTITSKTVMASVSDTPEILLHNVVCGSMMGFDTSSSATDTEHLIWTDGYTHFVSCHNSRETMCFEFYYGKG